MGWGRMLLLGNFGQQMDIEESKEDVAALRRALGDQRQIDYKLLASDKEQERQIAALQLENEALQMCVATLAKLLRDKGVVSDAEMEKIASLIDMDS